MDKSKFVEAINKAITESEKKKFTQRIDVVINLKSLDFKKPEHQIDMFVSYPHQIGKKIKVCALVGAELIDEEKSNCDFSVKSDDFNQYTENKRLIKKMASEYDFFIAQANIMPQVATTFGRILGPRNKMPNPKAGCVVPPKVNLKPLYQKLQKMSRVVAKKTPIIQTAIGNQSMTVDDLTENFMQLYNQLIHTLPNEENNVKSVYVKLTMGKPIKVA